MPSPRSLPGDMPCTRSLPAGHARSQVPSLGMAGPGSFTGVYLVHPQYTPRCAEPAGISIPPVLTVEYWVQQTPVELHWMCCTGFE